MKVSDLAEIFIGVPISRYKYNENKDVQKFAYPLFSQNMLSNTGIFQNFKAETFLANKDLSNSCTQTGDIVYGLRQPSSAVYIDELSCGLLVPSYMVIIRCNRSYVLPEYLAFQLNTPQVYHQLYKSIQGSVIPLLKIQDVKEISLDFPSIEKQRKIIEVAKTGYQEIEILKQLIREKQKLLKSII